MTDITMPEKPDQVEIGHAFDSLEIDPVLMEIAKTNSIQHISWDNLKQMIQAILTEQRRLMSDKITNQVTRQSVDALCLAIDHVIQDQSHCPFTIQRVCELVISPASYYRMYIKYLRAVQKVVSIQSAWDDYTYLPLDTVMTEENSISEDDDEEDDELDDMFNHLNTMKVEDRRSNLTDFSKHKASSTH